MGTADRLAEAVLAGEPVDGLSVAGFVRAHWAGHDELTWPKQSMCSPISDRFASAGSSARAADRAPSDRATPEHRQPGEDHQPEAAGMRIKADEGACVTLAPFRKGAIGADDRFIATRAACT